MAGRPRPVRSQWSSDRYSACRASAERLYRFAAEGGYAPALLSLAWVRRDAGDAEEAERLFRTAIDAGRPDAVGALAQLWEESGDHERSGRLVLYGLEPDGTSTAPWLPLREGHEPSLGHYAVEGWLKISRHAAD
ncbi:hypothetical protein OIB37_28825 [Streptomyces sp. NBC_00820]|uniref:hypothetical protein n=1 Tax=Streptomyces sp. NBC_00820 TaxID=2975842 RepID=UPI002ED4126F|nr:hypothetical protein OIB37_28825 [Streptomyces sp. NBC_00820]